MGRISLAKSTCPDGAGVRCPLRPEVQPRVLNPDDDDNNGNQNRSGKSVIEHCQASKTRATCFSGRRQTIPLFLKVVMPASVRIQELGITEQQARPTFEFCNNAAHLFPTPCQRRRVIYASNRVELPGFDDLA